MFTGWTGEQLAINCLFYIFLKDDNRQEQECILRTIFQLK